MEDSTIKKEPLKTPKLLKGVPSKSDQFVFVDSTTNEPIDASSISLLVVDDLSQLNEPEPQEEDSFDIKSLLQENPNSGKYTSFTHRDSVNYLNLKNSIKRVFNNFKFAKNQHKWQLETLTRIKEQKKRDVFELPKKFNEAMGEKMGTTSPEYEEFDLSNAYKPRTYDPTSLGMVETIAPPKVEQPEPKPVVEEPKPTPQRIKYDDVTSRYADSPELKVEGDIETNLNMTDEEREQRRLAALQAEEEKNRTVINDETNPIPDVHLDLSDLDKDLVLYDKPKTEDVKVEEEKKDMPDEHFSPFAPKDNSVFTPEFNDEYLQHNDNGEAFQQVYGDDQKRSVSIMNTETGEKQVIIDMSKEKEEVLNENGEVVESLPEDNTGIPQEKTTHHREEIQKGKKTYKLKKYKKDIIPEDKIQGRKVAWLAYILFFIPLMFMGNNTFVRHHANEGLELNIMEIVAAILIVPFFVIQAQTETIMYVLVIMLICGIMLALVLAIAMLMSIIFSLCGQTSNLPFFWGFRFIPVARKQKAPKKEENA